MLDPPPPPHAANIELKMTTANGFFLENIQLLVLATSFPYYSSGIKIPDKDFAAISITRMILMASGTILQVLRKYVTYH